ncbi:MAG TPA: hypothetical protein VJ715_14545, partial [Pyrinomonadaceae bacterium]|nr:hypothetical protein [Pyrinomonadaceae bacterium]
MSNQSRRIKPALLEADRSSLASLQGVAGYAPANPAYALTAIARAQEELDAAQDAEARAEAALASARDNAV